ncbi:MULTISPECIES: hypothetical protein [unclassified Haladaptatus]|uniref:hypothetical protein n=1 Tax=unclassified Haladaptatus TaxID=2622732 RepID=UPI0023E8CD12|nr:MULTISPECIES: hypothetical protein [unclassified Haladaptatus]
MNFDERFGQLLTHGDRDQAQTLAKAILRNEPVVAVKVTDSEVHVETPSFRGTHAVSVDNFGKVTIHQQGAYRYKSERIDLSFKTLTMNEKAYEQAQAHLTEEDEESTAEPETQVTDEAASAAADKQELKEDGSGVESTVDYLKQFL